MCETEIVSCRVLNNKSYYHCFTAIKFAKPSWRALQSMIPFIANPTNFVEKYRTARIYSPWRFLPPRNTPDLFCRCFTRQNHRCAAWAVFFFSGNLSGQSPSILLCKTVPLLKKPLGLSLLRYACKRKPYLENFISRPSVIPTFCQRRCTNRGRNFVQVKRRPHYMSRITSTYFLRLNNSETITQKRFWAQR